MKVAVYIRVSTQEQAQEGYSIEAQTSRLQAYCQAKDWTVVGNYTDAGYSGSNTNRPALQRLLGDVAAGLIDCVLVYKLDRLSRSQKDTLMLIEDRFLAAGVSFVSMSENFDTSTPLGRAMVGILSVFAQLEREQIRERMSLGRAERAKNGYWHGGGRPPFGYTYSQEDGLLHVNSIEAEIVRECYVLFMQRTPITTICNTLSKKYGRVITQTIAQSILSTPLYTGVICWEGETYEGRHEALVTNDTFAAAQRLWADRRRIAESKPDPFKPRHLLGSLLVCGNCGARYIAKGNYSGRGKNRRYYPYYTCYSRAKTHHEKVVDVSCRNPSYPCEELDALIMEEVLSIAKDQSAFLVLVNAQKPQIFPLGKRDTLLRRIDDLDAQIRRVLDLYQLGTIGIADIKERMAALEKEKTALTDQLKADTSEQSALLPSSVARTLLDDFVRVADSGDVKLIRRVLCELIKDIIVLPDKGGIQIVWNF